MEGRVFFSESSWLDKEVSFSWLQPSKWTTTKKVSEKSGQLTLDDVNHPLLGGSTISFASATFLCQNTCRPEQEEEAFMKVYRQVPHSGTEYNSHAVRKAQAGDYIHEDIEAYKLFTQKKVRYLSTCLGEKLEFQDDFDIVPQGYIRYVVHSKLPGLRLDRTRYWSLRYFQRKAICEAFLSAYRELHACGVETTFHGIENLLWNEEEEIVYIVDFDDASPITLEDTDEPIVLASWGLTNP